MDEITHLSKEGHVAEVSKRLVGWMTFMIDALKAEHDAYRPSNALKYFREIAKPRWIVGTKESGFNGQLGFRIFGMNFWYYKWNDPDPSFENADQWREAEKREFGECINSQLNQPSNEG